MNNLFEFKLKALCVDFFFFMFTCLYLEVKFFLCPEPTDSMFHLSCALWLNEELNLKQE